MLAFMILLAAPLLALAAPAKHSGHTNFYLATTPEKVAAPANQTGVDLADPYYDPQYLLRVHPSSASYPTFNLTKT